ncbi:Phosphate acyltransferase [Desulfovibrionales bacterium]
MISNSKPIIAVDVMGGDYGPGVLIAGAVDALKEVEANLVLVGDETIIRNELKQLYADHLTIRIVHASQVVEMDDKPSDVLRSKKDASVNVAIQLVASGQAQGVVSAGNSGATVASGMFSLGRIPGVERPALASMMFTEKNPMVLIDVGANVDCKPYHLFQFGLMADVLARDMLGIPRPQVGILSIGEEKGKGNFQVKEAFELFKMTSLNFVGNVEGRDIFSGNLDVVVCDGFVGNVVLKLCEGLTTSLSQVLKRELNKGLISRFGALLTLDAFHRFSKLVDWAEYGGAPLIGLKGIVIVCHGSSNAKAMNRAIGMAAKLIEKKANKHLMAELSANEELTRFGKAAMKR